MRIVSQPIKIHHFWHN